MRGHEPDRILQCGNPIAHQMLADQPDRRIFSGRPRDEFGRSDGALLGNGMVVLERRTEREPGSRVPCDGTEFLRPPGVVADISTALGKLLPRKAACVSRSGKGSPHQRGVRGLVSRLVHRDRHAQKGCRYRRGIFAWAGVLALE